MATRRGRALQPPPPPPPPPPPLPAADVRTQVLAGLARILERHVDAPRAGPGTVYEQFRKMNPKDFADTTDPLVAEGWIRLLEYFTADVRACLNKEFLSLRQRDLSVAQFVVKFERGCHFVPLIEDDEAEKLQHFIVGLRPTIHRDVLMAEPADYASALRRALRSEQTLKDISAEAQSKRPLPSHGSQQQHGKRPFTGPQHQQGPFRPQGNLAHRPQGHHVQRPQGQQAPRPAPPKTGEKPVCPKCHHAHHGQSLAGAGVCYRCKKSGHVVSDCPLRAMPTQGRVFVMQAEEADPDTTLVTGAYFVLISRVEIDNYEYGICWLRMQPVVADLIVLSMPEFDLILGMDWMTKNAVVIDFQLRSVLVRPEGEEPFQFEAIRGSRKTRIISFMQAKQMVHEGCEAFLASLSLTEVPVIPDISDVDIVRDFEDVFPDDVAGIPPVREVEFSIDLVPGTVPIS
ncbi:uncharacterized protein [Henckelia pumila]|uniref:uncharacterized protein n=1 Tax=Henckelia pumila TaxID=405737 RepID=UPI003C6DDA61